MSNRFESNSGSAAGFIERRDALATVHTDYLQALERGEYSQSLVGGITVDIEPLQALVRFLDPQRVHADDERLATTTSLSKLGIGHRELLLRAGLITAEEAAQSDAIVTSDGRVEPYFSEEALEEIRDMEQRARSESSSEDAQS